MNENQVQPNYSVVTIVFLALLTVGQIFLFSVFLATVVEEKPETQLVCVRKISQDFPAGVMVDPALCNETDLYFLMEVASNEKEE